MDLRLLLLVIINEREKDLYLVADTLLPDPLRNTTYDPLDGSFEARPMFYGCELYVPFMKFGRNVKGPQNQIVLEIR